MRSWAIRTFSEPLTTKYPPWSSGHSPRAERSEEPRPERAQKSERSMMGTSPMKTFGYSSTSTSSPRSAAAAAPAPSLSSSSTSPAPPSSSPSFFSLGLRTVFVTSTYSGAAYVRLRSRASFGNRIAVSPSASVIVGFDR